mmetsp:Transcript_2513/g.5301  ORF Transcript_2513/g.5301 Transcript_2513/m.5301 type:complete len:322 (-) Transcript_2513:100-1065(-)
MAANASSPGKAGKAVPAWAKQPFEKQLWRDKAVQGKLLEDAQMTRVLTGKGGNAVLDQDATWVPDQSKLSHFRDHGVVADFGQQLGRIDLARLGSRSTADGARESHWRPEKPASIALTKPRVPSSGVQFAKQTTREQGVTGKLLEDMAMTRFLVGTGGANGHEYYDGAHDSLETPSRASHRARNGVGNHSFGSQTGRLSLARSGQRSAVEGSRPSYWEPGLGYSHEKRHGKVRSWDKQIGRVDLNVTGMRGAPAKVNPNLGSESAPRRPATVGSASSFGGRAPMHIAHKHHRGIMPVTHVMTTSMDKQLSREAWASKPIRT